MKLFSRFFKPRPQPKPPSTLGQDPQEQLAIAQAKSLDLDTLTVMFNGHPTKICGKCGRIVCHPDCPRGGFR